MIGVASDIAYLPCGVTVFKAWAHNHSGDIGGSTGLFDNRWNLSRSFLCILVLFYSLLLAGCTEDDVFNAFADSSDEGSVGVLEYESAALSGNPDNCLKLGDSLAKSNCLKRMAEIEKNASICELVAVKQYREECLSSVMVMLSNTAGCDGLTDEYQKDVCYWDIAKKSKDDSLCQKVVDPINKRKCLYDLAIAKNRVGICDEIAKTDPGIANNCYAELAKKNADPSFCRKMTLYSEDCIADAAYAANDEKVCYKIEEYRLRNRCVGNVAAQKKDASLCDYMYNDMGARDDCLFKVAIAAGKPELCNQIQTGSLKNACLQNAK